MNEQMYCIIAAVIALVLIPLVPKMICLRARVLRAVHWNSLAEWHERHLNVLVPIVRAILAAIAVVLLVLGLS
jgi:hypothetical protein